MISDSDVQKLAHLARLKLSSSEVQEFTRSLSSIIQYVKQLDEIDTSEVAPTSHVHGSTNVFREDTVSPSLPVEDALGNAPDMSGRFIRVPIIIEQEGS